MTGWKVLALLSLFPAMLLARCAASRSPVPPAPTAQGAPVALRVDVQPMGSDVYVNQNKVGGTPISLCLSPGNYVVRVERAGYEPLIQEVRLASGSEGVVTGTLSLVPPSGVPTQARPPASPSVAAATEPAPGQPEATAGPASQGAPPATGTLPRATAASPSPPPTTSIPSPDRPSSTLTPLPPTTIPFPTATRVPPVSVREGQVTIPTYPYAGFLVQARNTTFNVPYTVLDRAAYEASNPAPREVAYRTIVLENDVLRLTFVPELGGRLYEVLYKPVGHRVTYRNPVLKPSPWGPPEQGWWLAAGGLEWCLPVEEHGYEWGVPWTAEITRDATGATVTLRDTTANDRVRAAVAVRLESGAGAFTVRPRLENPTGSPLAVKYWTNAMLAPGGRNAPSPGLRFVLPDTVTAVTVHSRGDDWLPGPNQRLSWPVFNGVDLSRLGNWNRWLGFFEDPAAGDFIAVYDEIYDEGVVRVFPANVARGAKGFAFGWGDPIPPDNWTDDGSSYVEIHGGPAQTFDDSVTLPSRGHLEWTEIWYPVAGLGGLRVANALAALNLSASADEIRLAAGVTRPWSGDVLVLVNGAESWRQTVSLVPGQTFRAAFSPPQGSAGATPVTLRLEAASGQVAAEYHTNLSW